MDADTNDSVSAIHAGELALNGVIKADDLQTAIINKVLIIVVNWFIKAQCSEVGNYMNLLCKLY